MSTTMPKSPVHHDDSDDFSSGNENSNLSEINPHVLSTQANLLRQASQLSAAASAFNQNSSSSTSSVANHSQIINCNQNSNASSANSANKKFRHQNFSKNIYIGTKNAERWDNLRNLFQFKNDVEFVSFLLTTAENEAQSSKNGFKLPMFQKENSQADNSQDYEKEQSTSSFMQKQPPSHAKQQQQQVEKEQHMSQKQMPKKLKRVQFQDNVNIINDGMSPAQEMSSKLSKSNDNNAQDHSISSTIDGSVSSDESNNTTEILDCRIEEKIKSELEEKQKMIESGRSSGSSGRGRYDEAPTPPPISSSLIDKKELSDAEDEGLDEAAQRLNLSKRRFYDIRKAPAMLDGKMSELADVNLDKSVFDFKDDDEDDDFEGRLEINSDFMIRDRKTTTTVKKSYKNKLCLACNTKHGKESCPIRNPISSISNQIDFSDWIQEHPIIEPPKPVYDKDEPLEDEKMFYDDSIKSENEFDDLEDDGEEDDEPDDKPNEQLEPLNEITFADVSLPNEFEFLQSVTYPTCKRSIFTKIIIPKYTQIGPLVGVITPEIDIPDDCNMSLMFEIHDSILSKSIYFNMENKQKSNWVRYLQPARARDQRNLTLIKVEDKIYFVSSMDINVGCELLYWSDDINSAWGKKKVEKTNCGGCNLRFEHPLHYRTHCSVFHDPGFSLTIRKYHCKICGVAVLGKDNIMKHAEKLHDGKGAYQCQFCKKFFLRLNYLEMHRTYGCAANPQRARPLCDFCGRKFCQPQKLKVHIKRMHSDMAEVLRDFQCKLCSKLLGSRAALQRHSKEVHSRNSAVVSCPRCQKLFQNRSNLKIHMLTHSGVRPFKCAESECTAAFTTKQCLQFHYKKVHGFTQEQMPKIERSVAYTFDAYSGGLKNEALEGMTRRQRKNLGESLNKATRSMPQREKEMILKDKNFLTSITDLCKNESNLNLLSSKISSILSCNLKEMNKKLMNNGNPDDMAMEHENDENGYQESNEYSETMNTSHSDMEQKIMLGRNMRNLLQPKHDQEMMLNDSISGNDTNDMEPDEDDDDGEDSERNSFKAPVNRRGLLETPSITNPRFKDFLLQTNPNLVISKGSKKWISDSNPMSDIEDNDTNMMTQANRDFLAKLISSKLHKGSNQSRNPDETNEHSPILDVVDSNLHQQQQSQQEPNQFNQNFNHQNAIAQNNNSMMEIQSQFQNNTNSSNQNTFNSHFNHLGSFYNGNSQANRNLSASIPTSASLLVEAALNSVSNMIGNNEINDGGSDQQMNMHDNESHQQNLPDEMTSPEFQNSHSMMTSHDDDNMKMIKSQNFPIHLPSMASFNNAVNTNMMAESNKIEIDPSSTPESHEKLCSYSTSGDKEVNVNSFQNQTNDSCSPARTMTPDQHNGNYNQNFASQRNAQVAQIQTSPIGHLSARPMYGSEHDLASPASTPSLPRYDFGSEGYRRDRSKNLSANSNVNYQKNMQNLHQQQQQQTSQIAQHISSDEENSIVIAENLSVSHQNQNHIVHEKIKLNSQIDLLYANNASSSANQPNQLHRESLNDLRLKYNEQGLEIQEFSRNSVVNDNIGGGGGSGNGSDYQGLDMTASRSAGLGYHGHSFQLSSAAGSNLSFNRYQHHIYDILTDREQQAQNQQQQEHHSFQLQQQQQQIQHLLQDHISHDQDSDQIQAGVDLSRTSNTYIVPPSPPHLPYSHTHSEMLRMASLDLSSGSSGTSAGMVSGNNSHHVRHHSTFLTHAANRELPDHHRFLSTADQRLLVDPTAHLLLEQNNRLLSSDNNRILDQSRLLTEGPTNRHVVSPRGFGAYHHHSHHPHHQVKYHQGPPSNQQQNYHPFSASYY